MFVLFLGSNKSNKAVDNASSSAEVYDISRFQKVISKAQMPEPSLPSPPYLQACARPTSRLSESPCSLVNPSSPECDSEDRVMTSRELTDSRYPYLRPIKDDQQDLVAMARCRASPDIPLYAPTPVKGNELITLILLIPRSIIHETAR